MSKPIVIINGSHRKNSQSLKVSRFIENVLKNEFKVDAEILSLADNPLPLWDDSIWAGNPKIQTLWDPFSKKLQTASAFVVVTPEWGGMVPAGLKNLLLYCGRAELYHKPATIVSVSSGMGGSYPVSELRTSGYKNTHICYTPEHVIIRFVEKCLNHIENTLLAPENSDDEAVQKRLRYGLSVLIEYASAFEKIRESGVLKPKEFPYGL